MIEAIFYAYATHSHTKIYIPSSNNPNANAIYTIISCILFCSQILTPQRVNQLLESIRPIYCFASNIYSLLYDIGSYRRGMLFKSKWPFSALILGLLFASEMSLIVIIKCKPAANISAIIAGVIHIVVVHSFGHSMAFLSYVDLIGTNGIQIHLKTFIALHIRLRHAEMLEIYETNTNFYPWHLSGLFFSLFSLSALLASHLLCMFLAPQRNIYCWHLVILMSRTYKLAAFVAF